MIYFTDEDTSIIHEKQRDPLGFQSIWSYYASKVIKNITTVSNDFKGFREVLLCLDICNSYKEEKNSGLNDTVLMNYYILCFEQLFIYSMIEDNKSDGIAGGDAGTKKFKEMKDKLEISKDKTILVNQIGLGYYGRYKSPLHNMGLIDGKSRMQIKHEEVRKLFGDSYDTVKNNMYDFFSAYEKNDYKLAFKGFKGKEKLRKAICGNLREGEYDFWMEKFEISTNPLMQLCYYTEGDEDNCDKSIFHKVFDDYEPKSKDVQNILELEPYIRCIEKVFYMMLNSASFKEMTEKLGSLKEYQNRYDKFIKIEFKSDSSALRRRFSMLQKCNPYNIDYLENVYLYHKFVCEQKNRGRWLDVNESGVIQSFSKGKDNIDIYSWERNYYLASLKGIKKDLEKLNA